MTDVYWPKIASCAHARPLTASCSACDQFAALDAHDKDCECPRKPRFDNRYVIDLVTMPRWGGRRGGHVTAIDGHPGRYGFDGSSSAVPYCAHGAVIPIDYAGRFARYKCVGCDAQRAADKEQADRVKAELKVYRQGVAARKKAESDARKAAAAKAKAERAAARKTKVTASA